MNWAFVDYENVGSLAALKLSHYERVFVFCGPRNTKIAIDTLPAGEFCSIELIRISTTGANNLDFHMAFHIGRLHETARSDVAFHIVSNDSGFNGLTHHLKKLGRTCKQVALKAAKPAENAKPSTANVMTAPASEVMSKLNSTADRMRPRKKEKLLNWMKSHGNLLMNGASPEDVYQELLRAGFVLESGPDVSYETKP